MQPPAIHAYGPAPEGAWVRALGWAVSFGSVLLETGTADHPRHARIGSDILQRIAEGPGVDELRASEHQNQGRIT